MQAYHENLVAQRDSLESQILGVGQALTALGSAGPAKPTRGRHSNGIREDSLKDHISRVLRGRRAMAVKDINSAVLKAGYKTKNKTLANSISAALAEMPNAVRVSRGMFRLR